MHSGGKFRSKIRVAGRFVSWPFFVPGLASPFPLAPYCACPLTLPRILFCSTSTYLGIMPPVQLRYQDYPPPRWFYVVVEPDVIILHIYTFCKPPNFELGITV